MSKVSLKSKVQDIIYTKQLNSYMNTTKWNKLISFIRTLPFEPLYQIKYVYYEGVQEDNPTLFYDSFGMGLWTDEILFPYYNIEWICIRPRILIHQGRLIPPKIESVENELLSFITSNNIYFENTNSSIILYGYKS